MQNRRLTLPLLWCTRRTTQNQSQKNVTARGRLFKFLACALFLGTLATCIGLYVSVSPLMSESLYSRVLFFPKKLCTEYNDFKKYNLSRPEFVAFTNNAGNRLTGWYFKSPAEKRVAVLSHGQGGDMTYMLPYVHPMLDLNCSVLLYNFRGFGDSQGSPSVLGICDDGLAAFDYLTKEKGWNHKNIYVGGVSLGSGVACDTAQVRDAGGVILFSSYSSLHRAAHEVMFPSRVFPAFLFPKNGLDNAVAMSKIRTPLLILHGAKDALFSLDHATKIYESAAGPKQIHVFDRCGHGNIAKCATEYRDALAVFFNSP